MKTLRILHRIFLPLVALTLFVLSACSEHPTGTGPVSGTTVSGMLNDEQGFVVPGATVEAVDASNTRITSDVTTDEGTFALKGLPADMKGIHVRVEQASFKPFTSTLQEIVGSAGGTTGVLMHVMHDDSCCAHLTVHATGANGVPLGGVEVRLRRGDHLITTGHTNDNGDVTFSNVCGGEVNLRLAKDGYQVSERGGIHIVGCDSSRAEFSMRAAGNDHNGERDTCCNGKLRIAPLDSATGAILSGAHVVVTKAGATTRTGTTTGDGITFRELCTGTYVVHITKDGYHGVEFTVTLHCNDSVYTDRRMAANGNGGGGDTCCNGRLQITLRDSTNNAVMAGATVVMTGNGHTYTGTSNGDGRVVFEGLCQGTYNIVVTKDGFQRQEFHVELGCNQHLEREYHIPHVANNDSCCAGVVTVIVRDSTTNAVLANTTVHLWRNGAIYRTGTTNGDGRVVFDGLCQGGYGLDFTHDGYGSREATTTLGCNQHLEWNERLLANHVDSCCNAVFRFHVKDSAVADGGWITGVHVVIKRGNDTIASGTTNGDGLYAHEGICGNATYTVTFSKDGFHSKTTTYVLTGCRTVDETIRLTRN